MSNKYNIHLRAWTFILGIFVMLGVIFIAALSKIGTIVLLISLVIAYIIFSGYMAALR